MSSSSPSSSSAATMMTNAARMNNYVVTPLLFTLLVSSGFYVLHYMVLYRAPPLLAKQVCIGSGIAFCFFFMAYIGLRFSERNLA